MARELKRKLDYSDLQVTPDDGRRYELVHGALLVTPSPKPSHQRISKRLLAALMDYFEAQSLGEVFHAPIDLILTKADVFVPDLVVVADPRLVTDRGVEGPPLLVVEILSPSTAKRDRGLKARRYAELGVEHYWIVDPDRKGADCCRLAGEAYRQVASRRGDTTLTHPDLGGLSVDLTALWR